MKYRDLPFRIIASVLAALLASELGSSHSLAERLHTTEFYLEFGVSFAITIIVVSIVYLATRFLDQRFDWFQKTVVRIALQIALGVLVPALVVFLLASGYFAYFGINIFRTDYLYFAFPYIILLIVIFNVYYYAYYLFLRLKKEQSELSPKEHVQANTSYKQVLKIQDGITTTLISIPEVSHIFLEGRQLIVRNFEGKGFLLDGTLEELGEQLDPKDFFRLNRQLIASRKSCRGYEPLEYGKLSVLLVPEYKGDTTVSQKKAPIFKNWIISNPTQ